MQPGLALVVSVLMLAACWIWRPASGWTSSSQAGSADVAYQRFLATPYFTGLDGLRGISVIAVIWTHVSGPHTLRLLTHGNKGVDLFFAISGFLVTTLLLRERRRNGSISLKNFYIRRTLRIFPLYYAVLSLYCVLVYVAFRGTPKALEFWDDFPAFASYTSNWFVSAEDGAEHGATFYFAWSLATEEQFYLFWPPLLVLLLTNTRRYLVAVLAVLLLIGFQITAAQFGTGLFGTVIASLAPSILVGVAFALLLNSRSAFRMAYPVLGNLATAPLATFFLLVLLEFDVIGLPVSLVIAVLVASICVRGDTVLHPVLKFRPLQYIGLVSYGIYLMHMLAANVVRKLTGHHEGLDVFVLTTALVVGMAGLSYRYFESPLLNLKKHFVNGTPSNVTSPIGSTPGTA